MDLLWKKDASGLLTDLFANRDPVSALSYQMKVAIAAQRNKKKNETSTQLRQKGNAKFAEKDWCGAMTYYNLSLRYAETGTENVSLAYANRSICFLKMEIYDKCLIDIELAIKVNYPHRLHVKLEERRALCLKQMNKVTTAFQLHAQNLDFNADEHFPGMGNVLKMKYNNKYGRHFIAKRDIEAGKVVLFEEAFVTSIIMTPGFSICDNCFKTSANFIACPECTTALFCDQSCAECNAHKLRCDRSSRDDNHLVEYVIRANMHAISLFFEFDELMDFVEGVIGEKDRQKEVPHSISGPRNKYRLFLNLNLWLSTDEQKSLIDAGNEAFRILMCVMKPLLNEKQERFFIHLSVLHTYIVFSNSFQTATTGGIFLLQNHLNHSCAPNLFREFVGNKSVCTTLRRIKKGEQLFISYTQKESEWPQHERRNYLRNGFGFECECERCCTVDWLVSTDVMKSDANFQSLAKEMEEFLIKEVEYRGSAKRACLKKKCFEMLVRFADLSWCSEMDMVYGWLVRLNDKILY